MFYTVTSVLQLRHDNVLVVGGSKLGQNPGSGSGSKFNVFVSTTLVAAEPSAPAEPETHHLYPDLHSIAR